MRRYLRPVCLLALGLASVQSGCPFANLRAGRDDVRMLATNDADAYRQAVAKLDWAAVKADLTQLLATSQDFWPADYGHYGPFMIRLAWHCSGSYRQYDGLGGCDGARQRFDPERSWPDNTNLDKARKLLGPLKEKYGLGLSWGDLIILAGNVAIESMGGPVLGFCAGRLDDVDGTDSELLGPTAAQEQHFPCPVNGQCTAPLGANTVGLIYVNPEGPMGNPIPDQSVLGVREVFSRMSMNDSETVALIGGGHAFGKTHGACPAGPGPSPAENETNPWPGMCGTGKGADAYTSGFEGQWTPTPTKWSNTYFQELRDNQWEVYVGPGGKHQWRPQAGQPAEPSKIMMLTTDVSLMHDPQGEFQKLVKQFAADQASLDNAFSHAWYKLVTRDMGPVTRCIGPWVPPAQPWQNPLPPTPTKLADFRAVQHALRQQLATPPPTTAVATKERVTSPTASAFATLAWQCATTFRQSDYRGGCNGARLRFAPEKDWEVNKGLDAVLAALQPIKDEFGEGLSWADLIVLAGGVGLEEAGAKKVPFCPGRTDAKDGLGSANLQPYFAYNTTVWDFEWKAKMLRLSPREMVVLSALPRNAKYMAAQGYQPDAHWTTPTPDALTNEYFSVLLNEKWEPCTSPSGKAQFKAPYKPNLYATPTDLMIRDTPDLAAAAKDYAYNAALFAQDFKAAWVKVMNNDRFDGPTGSVCNAQVEILA